MYTILLIVGLCFLITTAWLYIHERSEYGSGDLGLAVLIGMMAAIASAAPAVILAMYIGSQTPLLTSHQRIELVALADTQESHGRIGGAFFAVAGRVDQDMHYAYYYRTGPTSYRYRSVPHWKATIYEDEEEYPHVTILTTYQKPDALKWGITARVGESWEEIHIPKGSILTDFTLDLQ